MSLAPAVHPDIRGVEGKARPVHPHCCVPGCISLSQQGHHMWSRSYLRGQPYDWVSLPSGRVVSNVIGLCMRHHNEVTGSIGGHRAMIRMEPDETFIWLTAGEQAGVAVWTHAGLLYPQPWSENPVDLQPKRAVEEVAKTPARWHDHLAEGETCTACGYTRPQKREPRAKRPTKHYGLLVPDDAEIGSDVLDEWVGQLALILGFGDDVSQRLVRYHTIVAALAWTMQNRQAFIEDIMEVKAS